MDLIYTNIAGEEQGVLHSFSLDCEISAEQLDFVLRVPRAAAAYLKPGALVYCDEDTEFGGLLTRIGVDSASDTLEYYGLTWRGILAKKIIRPESGQAYRSYTLSDQKTASAIVTELLQASELDTLYQIASTSDYVAFQFDRYCTLLDGIEKLLRKSGKRLQCSYAPAQGRVLISARTPRVIDPADYPDGSVHLKLTKDYYPTTHVIGLGRGELASRDVYDVYLSDGGNPVTTRHYTGLEDMQEVYDYSNAESTAELQKGSAARLLEAQKNTGVELEIKDVSVTIGDVVQGTEPLTGESIEKEITGKILNMTEHDHTITFTTGDLTS